MTRNLTLALAAIAFLAVSCSQEAAVDQTPQARGIRPDQVFKLPPRTPTPTPTPLAMVPQDPAVVLSQVIATPTQDPVECDGLGHCWRWGAWRNPDDTIWEPPVAVLEAPGGVSAASAATGAVLGPARSDTSHGAFWWDQDPTCQGRADRYDWRSYAAVYDWPLDELAYVIDHESGGDLCAVNDTSGATCWIQQHPGGPQFLDPATCMAAGYAKWVSGGRSFYAHWFAWW